MTFADKIKNFDFVNNSTIANLLDLCLEAKTKEEALLIITRYCAVNKYAMQNLGYIFGYCNEADRKKLYSLFQVAHPIFGSGFGRVY